MVKIISLDSNVDICVPTSATASRVVHMEIESKHNNAEEMTRIKITVRDRHDAMMTKHCTRLNGKLLIVFNRYFQNRHHYRVKVIGYIICTLFYTIFFILHHMH